MRIVFQRLANGSIYIQDEKASEIDIGLLVFVGFHKDDKPDDIDWSVRKILSICFWPSEEKGPWRCGIKDVEGSILFVNEPGILAKCDATNQPQFDDVMPDDLANEMFESLISKAKSSYNPDRIFHAPYGGKVKLDFLNKGPVTFSIDSFHRRD